MRRGIRKNLQVELVIPIISFQGGILDTPIENFHDVFSLDQVGRLGVPKDAFQVYVRSAEGELFVDKDPSLALGDIVLGTKFDLLGESKWQSIQVAGEVLVKLPTGDEESFTSSGSTDLGFQLLATKYFRKSCLHGSVGLAYLGEMEALGLDSQVNPSGMLAYERGLGTKNSILLQATVSQSPFRQLDLEELKGVPVQLTLGYKRFSGSRFSFSGLPRTWPASTAARISGSMSAGLGCSSNQRAAPIAGDPTCHQPRNDSLNFLEVPRSWRLAAN